jgi:phosphonate degradation associated HDIG domain protein
MLSLSDIELLFERHGASQYSGEPVTQLQHALQTALLAEEAGADDALVTACLLHDLGHLLNDLGGSAGDTPSLRGIDDTHQYYALPFLRGLFPDTVLDAIKLHVDAKRYLCHADPGYHARLSDDSKRSLALQGGVFDAAAAAAFLGQSGAPDAVRLRQWDDLAKAADLRTPSLAHYLACAARCVLPTTTTAAPHARPA